MSDTQNSAPVNESGEEIKNLKSEVTRKTENLKSELEQLKLQNQKLMDLVAQRQAPEPKKEDLSDLFYRDPEGYTAAVEERTQKKVLAAINQQQALQQRHAQVVQSIVKEYPELNDEGSALYKRAVEIYSELGDDERTSPSAYKLAAIQAANEMGVKPRSKRSVDEDEPSIGSSSGSSSGSQRRNRQGKLDPAVQQWAEIMGLDTSDAKVKERLEQRAKREWTKYRSVK